MPRKAKHLVLLGPFRRQVGEADDAHTVWQGAADCGLDEIRREESQRDCHVHFTGGAALAFGNRFRICGWVGDKFFKPAASASD